MKLYYAPGACSLSSHIALREAGLPFDLEKVDLKAKKTEKGDDFGGINAKGYVPTLKLDDGGVLTECAVIAQYVADRKPEKNSAPAAGTPDRYRLQEWLNFIATEIHKGTSPLFNPATPDAYKQMTLDRLNTRYEMLAKHLANRPFLMGNGFTVADGYLFTILNWTNFVKIDLGKWPVLKEYMARVAARPAVQEALKAEGLIK